MIQVGINVHLASRDRLVKMVEAGFTNIRADFNGDMLWPERTRWDWAETDRLMADAADLGLSVYPTLAYAPSWCNGGQGRHVPATDPADWQHFVATVIARYRAQLTHVSLWNEPNRDFFAGTVYEYVSLVAAPAIATLREQFPSLQVCGPELALEGHWEGWLFTCLTTMPQPFNVVTVHNYQPTGRETLRQLVGPLPWYQRIPGPWQRLTVREVIARAGLAERPIWLTETGRSTGDVSEAEQASYYDQVFEGLQGSTGIARCYFYSHCDEAPGVHWGILHADLTPKPAYRICQARLGVSTHATLRSKSS